MAATAGRAVDVLLGAREITRWVAPDVSVTLHSRVARLGPGDRFRIQVFGALVFEYVVEAVSEREVVFSFRGPWDGSERWSFIADGAETIVRRVHEPRGASLVGGLAWSTVGRMAMMAHMKLELARFRDLVEREPGPRGEIEAPGSPPEVRSPSSVESLPAHDESPESYSPPFPVDEG